MSLRETVVELLSYTHARDLVAGFAPTWALAEMAHFIGMALLFGIIALADLRILGVGKRIPMAAIDALIPWAVFGFALNLVSGVIFVAGNVPGGPEEYFDNISFTIKMAIMLLAGVNLALYYTTGVAGRTHKLAAGESAPAVAKVFAASSLTLWILVIYFGRMIMYSDTFYVQFL